MNIARSVAAATSALVLAGLLAGCGDADASAPSGPPAAAASPSQADTPALPPTGTTARTVSYRCVSGRAGTLAVDVPDLGDLTDRLNRIRPCEYDHGLERVTLVVTCRSGPVVVHLMDEAGRLAQPADNALCRH
jgi:hypothetical protein